VRLEHIQPERQRVVRIIRQQIARDVQPRAIHVQAVRQVINFRAEHAVRAEPEHIAQPATPAAVVPITRAEPDVIHIQPQVTYVRDATPVISWQAEHVRRAEPEHGRQQVRQVVPITHRERDVRHIQRQATYVQNVAAVISWQAEHVHNAVPERMRQRARRHVRTAQRIPTRQQEHQAVRIIRQQTARQNLRPATHVQAARQAINFRAEHAVRVMPIHIVRPEIQAAAVRITRQQTAQRNRRRAIPVRSVMPAMDTQAVHVRHVRQAVHIQRVVQQHVQT